MRRIAIVVAALLGGGILAGGGLAATPEEDLAAIEARLDAQDQEIQTLRQQLAERAGEATATEYQYPAPVDPAAPDAPAYLAALPETLPSVVDEAKKAPAKPEDKKPAEKPAPPPFPTCKITGFMHLDNGWFDQSPNNIATVGDMQDGMGFRRARLAAGGQVAEFTNYFLEMDFAIAGRPSFTDVYVEQGNLPYLNNVRIGQYRQPFSADALSSIKALPFLERSLPFQAFVPFRRVGAMAWGVADDQMTQWAYGVYRTGGFLNNPPLGDPRYGTDIGDVGGYSFSTRATHCLYYDEPTQGRYLLTIGASYAYAQLGANDAVGSGTPGNAGTPRPFYQARAIPEFFLGYPDVAEPFGSAENGTPFFIDSGRFEAHNFNLWGVESIYQAGAVSVQSEWMGTVVDSVVGPVFYNGAYSEVCYRLTGEHRVFDPKTGTLKNPVPFEEFFSLRPGGVRGWGAWEVGARLSYINVRNPASLNGHYYNAATNTFTATADQGNGDLTNFTGGLTWFWNPGARWQFNWIHAMLDNRVRGDSTANLFVTRMQFDF